MNLCSNFAIGVSSIVAYESLKQSKSPLNSKGDRNRFNKNSVELPVSGHPKCLASVVALYGRSWSDHRECKFWEPTHAKDQFAATNVQGWALVPLGQHHRTGVSLCIQAFGLLGISAKKGKWETNWGLTSPRLSLFFFFHLPIKFLGKGWWHSKHLLSFAVRRYLY